MTGLMVLGLTVAWFMVVVSLTVYIANRFTRSLAKSAAAAIAFPLLLVTPVADELMGKWQFRGLCEKNAVFRKHVTNLEGRTTRVTFQPSNELVSRTAIPIYHSRERYVDVSTGELVLEFDWYVAKGGLLVRSLGVSEWNRPIVMARASCSPTQTDSGGVAAHSTFKFTVTN